MSDDDAVLVALQFFRQPQRKPEYSADSHPNGLTKLLKLAAGQADVIDAMVEKTGENKQVVQAAAVFYLQQMLVKPGLDNYALLGLRPGASSAQIKEHKRWLLMWLHPDKNHNSWETILFQRVVAAAKGLEHADSSTITTTRPDSRSTTDKKGHAKTRRHRAWQLTKNRSPVLNWKLLFKRTIRSIACLVGVGVSILGIIYVLADQVPLGRSYFAQLGWQLD